MANKRISELTSITGANLADTDLLVVVDVSDTTMAASGTNKKITMAELAKDSALTDNLVAKSTLTTNGDLLTRAAGEPAPITRADLAADSAFTSRYAPRTGDRVWLMATDTRTDAGGPSLDRVNSRTPALGFDASTTEQVSWAWAVPTWWQSMSVVLYWSNGGAGSGDVLWDSKGSEDGAGDTPTDVAGLGSRALYTAPAQNVIAATTLVASYTLGGDYMGHYRLTREGNNVNDTLGNDALLIGIMLVRVS